MQTLTDVLIVLFLALGCVWFAVDIVRKLREPAAPGNAEPRLGRLASAPAALTAPTPAPAAPSVATPSPAAITPAPAPAPLAATEPAAPAADGVPAPHLAVVAAVIHHLYKGRARLAGVLPAAVSVSTQTSPPIDWAREGRRDIFTSHRVR